jgi:uncharacterized protein (DUF2141 family)
MRRLSWLGGIMCFAAAPLCAQSPAPSAAGAGVTVTVIISGIQPRGGLIGAALFATADGFPKQHERAARRERQPDRSAVDSIVFRNVPPGRYAVAVHHDVDGNGLLAENAVGIPREPWAVSRNLRPRFSAPKFTEAAVDVRGDTRLEVVVK